MGLFGKKNKKKKQEQQQQQQQAAPPVNTQPIIRIIGDSKHITTTIIDAQGRPQQSTQVVKLTPDEMRQLGMTPPAPAPAPIQVQPPPQQQYHQQQQYVQQQQQQQPPPQQHHQQQNQMQRPPPSETYRAPAAQAPAAPVQMKQPPPQPKAPPSRAGPAPAPAPQMMRTPANDDVSQNSENPSGVDLTRALVRKFIADIWNRGEVELIPEVCHPSLRFNGHVGMDRVGHEGFARMVTTVRDALTDYHCEIHSMVCETNKAFCRLKFTGKHTGNLLGYPPTGKTVGWMGASEFTCKNGKILKVWELGDVKSLEEQLRTTEYPS